MRKIVAALVVVTAVAAVGCAPQNEPVAEAPPPVAVGLANGSFTANLNGLEMHYRVHGSGPIVMVVPQSWGLDINGLRPLYQPLEEKLTLVYFDPRGMGGSARIREPSDMGLAAVRADFNALRQHLGLESVNAIGWSNGAMNLVVLAAEKPETINNAVFVHGVASFTEEDMAEYGARHPEIMTKYATFQQEIQTNLDLTDADRTEMMKKLWLEDYFPASTADPESSAPMFEELFGYAEFSWAHADHGNRENPTFDARDRLASITARSLVIAGAHDMMTVEKVRELADGIPDAQFLLFENSGHFAPAEETEAFTAAVWEFFGVE